MMIKGARAHSPTLGRGPGVLIFVSLRIVKDQTETVPLARSQPAHAVTNVHAVVEPGHSQDRTIRL